MNRFSVPERQNIASRLFCLCLALSLTGLSAPSQAAVQVPFIEKAAEKYKPSSDHEAKLFRNGIVNSLKQATEEADGTIYVATGDIPAEWLRDSSAQVRPYIFFAKEDPGVAKFMQGVIARQAIYLQKNPYANAFKENGDIWEEKYELDSLAYPVFLAWTYWKETGDASIFTESMKKALSVALTTMEQEQDHGNPKNGRLYEHKETAEGKRRPVKNTGMIWTAFRPSDDACYYNYLIPSEMMAVVALAQMSQIETEVYKDKDMADRARKLASEVHHGIQKYGVVEKPGFGKIYAYEVDGLGNHKLMDDANIPSLLSAPYLGYVQANDPIYMNTKRFLHSKENPFFYEGKFASGQGSPHTPKGYIWPLGLIMEGLTAVNDHDQAKALKQVLASDPGDNLLHESFDPNDPKKLTRPDFGWPNALFAEFMLVKQVPALPVVDDTWSSKANKSK